MSRANERLSIVIEQFLLLRHRLLVYGIGKGDVLRWIPAMAGQIMMVLFVRCTDRSRPFACGPLRLARLDEYNGR